MQQYSSRDQKWVSYIVIMFIYTIGVVKDWLSGLMFLLILLQFSGLIRRVWMFALIEVVFLVDFMIKSPYAIQYGIDVDSLKVQPHCILLIFEKRLKPILFFYVAAHLYNFYLLIYYISTRKRFVNIKTWGPLMTQVMVYTLPIVMYGLSIISEPYPLKVTWAILGCLQVLDLFTPINHFVCCLLVAFLFFFPQYNQYVADSSLSQTENMNAVICIIVIMMVFLNVYSNPHPDYKQTVDRNLDRSSRRVGARRYLQDQESKLRVKSVFTLGFAVLLCLITTSIGNVVILFAIYFNIPRFKGRRFFFFLSLGVIISVSLEPHQIPYFVYLYTVVLILGQDISSEYEINYQRHSYSFLLDFYRLYIMFSHVSFLNWVIGLFKSSTVVVLAITIRICCRYFNYISVFIGTNDNYGMQDYFINSFYNLESMPDAILIGYLILLCLYSQEKAQTYQGSTVINILLEYPILEKIQKIFVIFRYFNWISYVCFSLVILARKPSLYILIHIFFLVLIISYNIIKSEASKNRSYCLKNLWIINFYITIIMIFTKYFYFLKQYESNSDFMDYLLDFLTSFEYWIGLDDLSQKTQGFAILKYFVYDALVLVLSWINIYIYKFEILHYEKQQQRRTQQQQNEEDPNKPDQQKNNKKLRQSYINELGENADEVDINEMERQEQEELTEQQKKLLMYRQVDYFYNRYIKPVELTHYLQRNDFKISQKILRDCLLDLSFVIIVVSYYLEQETAEYLFYLPLFIISGYAYFHKFTQLLKLSFTQRILKIYTAWTFCIVFTEYLYITFKQIENPQLPSAISKIYIGYILCVLMCLVYKLSTILPNRANLQEYHCIVYLILPHEIESNILWTEILSVLCELWLDFTMALFFTNIFSPYIISTIFHPFLLLYLLLSQIGKQKQRNWLHYVCLISIFDIWNYDFFAYFTVLAITFYYALKSAQKLSEEQKDGKIRHSYSSASSESVSFSDMTESIASSQQKRWSYYMAYCTIVWLLPQISSLIWMFGVVWLSPSLIATVLIAFSYCNLIYQLVSQQASKMSQKTYMITIFITTLFFCSEIYLFFYCFFVKGLEYNTSEMGLFLIFLSCFIFLTLRKRSVWYNKRSTDAQSYWDEKTELVGELGSQLHNEKKLITLQKYYTSKQKLTERVNNISNQARQNGRRVFQSFENFLKPNKSYEQTYELYTNMLIFLDMRLLKKCFQKLNQYSDPSIENNVVGENVVEKARTVRSQIYRIYGRSFNEAFQRFKNETEFKEEEKANEVSLSDSVRSSTINLEKVHQINQRYKQCFKLISRSTENFNKIFRLIIQNLQIISMMVVIGWNLYGGVYTIPVNIAIFGWAIVLENKTTVVFWMVIMSYASVILMLKQFMAQQPTVFIIKLVFYSHRTDYLYQFLIVLVSVVQIVILKLGGNREKTYSERESIYDAFYRAALNRASKGSQLDKQQGFMDIYKNLAEPQKHSFLYRVFSKSRFKPGKDFYPLMATVQLFILLYIFFFYDMMEFESKKNRKSIGELLTISQFSSNMVICLFLQVVIMIIDRVIVSLNLVDEENQKLQNFFLSFTFSISEVKYEAPEKLNNIGIFDVLLVLKYLFHLILLVMINFFVYFYIPSAGLTRSLIPSCNQAQCPNDSSYIYISIFLFLYFAYFLVSGLQIKHGFNRNKCKNVLMEKSHWFNYYTYKAFTAIPFAWEFKKICDWTMTSTALPLFHWMKFQDINARFYQSKCQAELIKIKPIKRPWYYYPMGLFGFLLVILIVFSPFIIYSPVNPFAVKDIVMGAQVDLYLRMDGKYDYMFFSTSHATVIENADIDFDLNLKDQNLFELKMSKYSDENFLISEPILEKLIKKIQKSISNKTHSFQFVLFLNVIEQEGGQSKIQWSQKNLSTKQLTDLYKLLTLQISTIVLQKFYSPFPGELDLESIQINTPSKGKYFQVSLFGSSSLNHKLYFYYLTSNKFKVSIGILTFYLTYILVISRLMRFYLTGTLRNVLYEGCYLQSILVLCQAVREARIVENFQQEESFYFELVDLMRHPQVLKKRTGDFVSFRQSCLK